MTKKERLCDLRQRANDIESILAPWKGMTFSEAEQMGFIDSHKILQAELWDLGRQIITLSEL